MGAIAAKLKMIRAKETKQQIMEGLMLTKAERYRGYMPPSCR